MFNLAWGNLTIGKSKNKSDAGVLNKKEYFDRVNYVRTASGLRKALMEQKHLSSNTSAPIDFKGLAFGATIRAAKQILGKPELHANKEEEVSGHEVLFYFSSLGSARVTECLHFLNGRFIMAQTIIKRPKPEKTKAVLASVLEQYGLLKDITEGITPEGFFPVCDQSRNRIEVHYAFDLMLTYVTGDADVFSLVEAAPAQEWYKGSFLRNAFREHLVRYV
ncbi:hypothetical protein TH63_00295 [Rufibacter radiotolerans]|uniref:Uncharacterized protein n=1 Tax=Rufibacter radiotolerans TaxID=1379910 RepID=A0A0H4VKL6_9BACT|nr:hypothetical protein [Rufibacter radiotolerans]AKQ44427.1 hypothetical protein TH63_00295 [Rufibacter radiotolerans]